MTTTRIDLSTEFFSGMNAPAAEQLGYAVRVNADEDAPNLEYHPLRQSLTATGTWDASSLSVHVTGSGARTIALPDPACECPGFEVCIVDASGNARVTWVEVTGQGERRLPNEPEVGAWKRLSVWFLGLLPIESQL